MQRIIESQINIKPSYSTSFGKYFLANFEDAFKSPQIRKYLGKVCLILTSPPFPLNRKKKYGNLNGRGYLDWLGQIAVICRDLLKEDGSLVIEIGNGWEHELPVMSTLPIKSLLQFKAKGNFYLCQSFIWYNNARLPSPVQWVSIERSRVKDSFTYIWWLSKIARPYADNRNILKEYSPSMKKLLSRQSYNSGVRPSEHVIGETSFLTNNNGSIPSNVLIGPNTESNTPYIKYCKKNEIEIHPARMPKFIAEFFIRFLTKKGDIVFDPFGGSNTTGAVSEEMRRKWVVIDNNEKYIEGSKGRFAQFRKI